MSSEDDATDILEVYTIKKKAGPGLDDEVVSLSSDEESGGDQDESNSNKARWESNANRWVARMQKAQKKKAASRKKKAAAKHPKKDRLESIKESVGIAFFNLHDTHEEKRKKYFAKKRLEESKLKKEAQVLGGSVDIKVETSSDAINDID